MDKSLLSKRVFYLEQALKKAWKEFNRLQKAVNPEKGFNRPFDNLEKEGNQGE